MPKFFNFVNKEESESADLYINGDIVDDNSQEVYEAFGFKCTAPSGFKEQLNACGGKPINVYIDSYGGDVVVASAIYTMLKEYKGEVTVKIDAIAASAASVIAMAGDKVLMSQTAFLMIHDPSTIVWGNLTDVKQGYEQLKAVKEGIINAYSQRANIDRDKIAKLMTDETWLDYNKALEYGFIDGEISAEKAIIPQEVLDSLKSQRMVIYNKIKPSAILGLPVEEKKADKVEIQKKHPTEAEIKAVEALYNATMLI